MRVEWGETNKLNKVDTTRLRHIKVTHYMWIHTGTTTYVMLSLEKKENLTQKAQLRAECSKGVE